MLHVHRAERADRLVGALAAVLADPLPDPLAVEVVAVPTRGVERWLTQSLSGLLGTRDGRADGVCANLAFPLPGALVGDAVAAASGIVRDADPWRPERTVWPLLEVVEAALDEPWLTALAAHLRGDGTPRDQDAAASPHRDRRLTAVRHLAGLFGRYAVHRPAMLRAWAAEDDTAGDGRALPADATWQAELWRRLRARLALPSPAERLEDACARLRDDPGVAALPDRLALFGLTRLPAAHVEVLAALAAGRDVHLHLLHPSAALWERVRTAGAARGPVRRPPLHDLPADGDGAEPIGARPANRLLATWGRDARELQLVLGAADAPRRDHHHALADGPPDSLLAHLQADVRADRPPPGDPLGDAADGRALLAPDDRSLQVHACHGRGRQVEVLRDAILHLLAADPTLEPRDVIVMCPDVEAFAPLVHATFGAGARHDDDAAATPDLRVRIADRSPRQTNPLLGAVAQLLELATGRVTASQVLDLAGREPVRRRFDLDDDDLARIETWVADTGIRWGLDAAHRSPTRVALEDGTWRRGLDRILAGVAMAEEDQRLVGGVLPLDDIASGDIALAGRLAELVDRLGTAVRALGQPRTVASWAAAVADAADALAATGDRDAWQRAQLGRILGDLLAEAATGPEGAASTAVVSPQDLRDLLADRLRGRPTTASFRTGHLTVCTLVPMRSVPHRVVCLLGLDDGIFPRRGAPDGDDLVTADPHVGDHDPRGEDRQLLLDALLAAREHLVITYAGRDERTNAPLPPAVPVGELLDVVDATARTADGRRARAAVVTHHPLQPFDVRNFATGPTALVGEAPWGFDTTALDGARALAGDRAERAGFLPGLLPPQEDDLLELDDLVRFAQAPIRAFLRRRLDITFTGDADELDDALPIELDGLDRWTVGQRLVEARLAGADPAAITAAELARGTLPPGRLAVPLLRQVGPEADAIAAAAAAALDEVATDAPPGSREVHLDLGDGRALVGTVAGLHGTLLRTATYSRLAPAHRLAAWVRLVVLTAAHPEEPWRAASIGRSGRRGCTVATAAIPPLGADPDERRARAHAHLAVLLDLHDRGLREPLPLPPKTAAAWAEARARGRDPDRSASGASAGTVFSDPDRSASGASARTVPSLPVGQAKRAWETTWQYPREDEDPGHRLVLGGVVTLDELLAEAPRPDEAGDGWDAAEPTRLGRLALRLWSGLLATESVVDR